MEGGLNINQFKDSTTKNIDQESMKLKTHIHGDFYKFSEIYDQHKGYSHKINIISLINQVKTPTSMFCLKMEER